MFRDQARTEDESFEKLDWIGTTDGNEEERVS